MADRTDYDLDIYATHNFAPGSTRHRVRQVAEDGALAIGPTDQYVLLLSSTSGAKAATFTTEVEAQDGQVVCVTLLARSGGSYTVDTDEGTTTLDTGGDFMVLQYSHADTAWHRLLYYDAANATIGSGAVGTTELADGAVTTVKLDADAVTGDQLADDAVDSEHYVDGSIDPVHLAATSVAPAANAACALLNTTTEVLLTISDATNTAITTTSAEPGQTILLRVAAASGGGSYTLAVTTGTLTLNSVGETALIKRNVADSAWFVVALTAGDAGGDPATLV